MMGKKEAYNQGSERRRHILKAALACFTDLGFTYTAISDICRRSGSSVGSLYHHFGSKEKIAESLYIEGIMDYQTGLLESLEKEAEAFRGIKAIIGYHLMWVKNNPDWARFLFQKKHESFMAGTDGTINELNREFAERIGNWFAVQVKAGKIKKLPRDIYIALLLGPCQEFARIYLTGKTVSDIDTAIEILSENAWISLSPASFKNKSDKGD